MYWSTLVSFALAIGALVSVYHDGALFENLRARDAAASEAFFAGYRRHFFGAVRSCRFCMSYWCAILLTPFLAASAVLQSPWSNLAALPVHALAAVRLAWIVNGLLPAQLRYGNTLQALEKSKVAPESPKWPDASEAGGGNTAAAEGVTEGPANPWKT